MNNLIFKSSKDPHVLDYLALVAPLGLHIRLAEGTLEDNLGS